MKRYNIIILDKSIAMNNYFEISILHTGLYKEILPYLYGKDLLYLSILNKYIYDEKYIQNYLFKKSSCIIKLFKRYHTLNSFIDKEYDTLQCDHHNRYGSYLECSLARKYHAMLYYSFYLKEHRYILYNRQIGWKKDIVDFYKKKDTDKPTKYDLYLLIKNMPISEAILIGW